MMIEGTSKDEVTCSLTKILQDSIVILRTHNYQRVCEFINLKNYMTKAKTSLIISLISGQKLKIYIMCTPTKRKCTCTSI